MMLTSSQHPDLGFVSLLRGKGRVPIVPWESDGSGPAEPQKCGQADNVKGEKRCLHVNGYALVCCPWPMHGRGRRLLGWGSLARNCDET